MNSILSTGEREVARLLREGHDVEAIAEERGVDVDQVEKARDRIREKTDRALATLAQSPFAAEAAASLDDETRERIFSELGEVGETG